VFDFAAVRAISKKIMVENDPAKIDRYLARLHAAVSSQLQSHPTPSAPCRTKRKRRPARRRSQNHTAHRPQKIK
jgi:hypothetical protein